MDAKRRRSCKKMPNDLWDSSHGRCRLPRKAGRRHFYLECRRVISAISFQHLTAPVINDRQLSGPMLGSIAPDWFLQERPRCAAAKIL